MPAVLTGRASKGIAHKLRQHGATLVCEPKSFLVTKDNHLEPSEEAHARDWGSAARGRVRRCLGVLGDLVAAVAVGRFAFKRRRTVSQG